MPGVHEPRRRGLDEPDDVFERELAADRLAVLQRRPRPLRRGPLGVDELGDRSTGTWSSRGRRVEREPAVGRRRSGVELGVERRVVGSAVGRSELGHHRGGAAGLEARHELEAVARPPRAAARGARRRARRAIDALGPAGVGRARPAAFERRREPVRAPRPRACGSGSRRDPRRRGGCDLRARRAPRRARRAVLRSGAAIHAVAKLGSGPGSTCPSATMRRAATYSSSSDPSAGVTGHRVAMIARSASASSTATLQRRSKPVGATQNDWCTGRRVRPDDLGEILRDAGWRSRSCGIGQQPQLAAVEAGRRARPARRRWLASCRCGHDARVRLEHDGAVLLVLGEGGDQCIDSSARRSGNRRTPLASIGLVCDHHLGGRARRRRSGRASFVLIGSIARHRPTPRR